MDAFKITSVLLILGTLLIYIGFGAFPWRIYTEKSVQEKLNLLAAHPRLWIVTQSFVILGGLTVLAGTILLIPVMRGTPGALLTTIGVVGFIVGHVFWIWHVGLRAVRPQAFSNNELPGGLFGIYSIFTLLALMGFGAAFWLQGSHRLLGIVIFLGALLTLGLFLKFKDMLPAVYYAMTLAIGLALLF
jgi:hypothetical protein